VSEGSYVNAATKVATLQRIDQLKVDFSIPERYGNRIKPGATIEFSVAGETQTFKGKIYALDPRIDSTTRTILIRALCPNPERRLLPGAFANVEVVLAEFADALLVPAMAVVPGLNEKNVFVVEDGKAQQRKVETGTRTESTVHILSGLHAGDVVITSGLQQLRPGQAVIVGDHT
jgi:membrane fusion protein (multidrug efflux system)